MRVMRALAAANKEKQNSIVAVDNCSPTYLHDNAHTDLQSAILEHGSYILISVFGFIRKQ
jgi:hypothetical protein